ncbi:class I SAM-dependent methyltransferase [uncultured Kriegella sp.]|uniref:class I SAM-dependent methyltransferase n=1 Tax=uncultured Kriegella sp. TaxID=1798910 RepID=UPI0030DAE58C|tara:strand:+ start:126547 stop:127374 length:828 start_codon:yes stop_codon:yes gene_type:complete
MKSYLKTKDYSVSKEDFELVQHPELEMLMTKPQPKDIERYYESENYISHSDSRKSLLEKTYQFVKRVTLFQKVKLVDRYVQDDKSILDIGAGTGDFLFAAAQKGWTISGVEPNSEARKRAFQKSVVLSSDIESVMHRKYKVITLWHVLEHLSDLENQILKMISLLEERGVLVVAVPNFNSYDAKYYQEYWAAYDVPRHLWHFSRNAIKKLFHKHGMEVVETRPMVFDSFYVSLLSEKYKTGKTNYLRAFQVGLRSNINAWSTKEYSSLIYVLKKA